jgi:exosome complex component CSL4
LKGEINLTEEGKFVTPGDVLGISEEFMPGVWAYEEEGNIYAAVSGKVEIDMKDRKINVVPKVSVPPKVKQGDSVIGMVWDVKAQVALLDIKKIKGLDRNLPGKARGAIHISKAREAYVSDLSREFVIGDIVMAKVVDVLREPIELSTSGTAFGVVKSACSKCGGLLEPFNKGLKCVECRQVESRKVSTDYGKGEI